MVQYSLRIVLFLGLVVPTYAQNPAWRKSADSLIAVVESADSDQQKVNALHRIAAILPAEEYLTAIEYTEQALSIALLNDDTHEIVRSFTNLGVIYHQHGNNLKAIECFRRALRAAPNDKPFLAPTYLELASAYRETAQFDSARVAIAHGLALNEGRNDKVLEASFHDVWGNIAQEQHNYDEAIQYYQRSAEAFKMANDKAGLAQAASRLADLHYGLRNYGLALEYATESLMHARETKRPELIAHGHQSVGRIFRMQRRFDEALSSYKEALDLYQSIDHRDMVRVLHNSIGEIWSERGNYAKAIDEYNAGLVLHISSNDAYKTAETYASIAQGYFAMNEFDRALPYLDSAQSIADAKEFAYVMKDVFNLRGQIASKRGDYKQAYEYLIKYSSLQDSLSAEESRLASRKVDAKFQYSKKGEETRYLSAASEIAALQLQQQRNQRNYLIGIAALALVLIAVLYNRYTIRVKTNQKLREIDEMKSRFFSNLSHEFKTPLQLITKPLEQRLATANTPEEKQELELMSRNAQRLSVLIEQLLDLSKLESGSMQLQVREDDIVQALKLVGASFASYADHKGIRFKVDIEPYSGPAFFDGEKVEKVLYNLLSNAFKFTGEKGTVQFRASVVNQHVVMFVKDSGIGIPQEKLPYIFNRFYQVEDPSLRFQEGSGIGLAICRELTELHRGTLTVESEEGQGSEFVFTIPISRSAYRKAEVMKHGGKKTSKRESTHITDKGLRSSGELPEDGLPLILIAEDDADMRFYIANTLKLNYRVISVADGRQAYDKALDVVPDLVVADVLMPHMDGRMLFHKLRSNAVTDHIPLVMLTERSDQQKPESGPQAAADDYLTKPFDARELLMRVHNLIQNRKNLFERVRDQGIRKLPVLPMPDADRQFLSRLTTTLDAHFANPGFGIDQLTERIGMSRMQLHRKLKALTNKAPGELLRQFRLEHAQELINKGFTVTEVAFKTGFPDLNTFNRALRDFTKVEKQSPVAKRQSPEHSS